MRGKKALFLTLILLTTVLQLPLAIGDAAWLAGWTHRVEITIDSGDIIGNLVNFPVLLHLSSSSGIEPDNVTFIFEEVGTNSLKIAVTEDDGITECKVEIETWNAPSEEAWLWVKVPSIAYDSNTTIYLYFDNDHADNDANVGVVGSGPGEAVWDEWFECVLHLNETVGDYMDSTDNDNDASVQGDGVTRGNPQKIGPGVDLAGSNDFLEIVNTGLGDGWDEMTLEIWTNYDTVAGGTDRASVSAWGGAGDIVILYYDATGTTQQRLLFSTDPSGAAGTFFGDDPPTAGIWYHLGGTFERDVDIKGWQNGVPTSVGGAADEPLNTIAYEIRLGILEGNSKDLDGKLDEFRISNTTRTEAWLVASIESGNDDLVDYGEHEEYEAPPIDTPTYLFGAGFNGSAPVVDLYWTSNHTDIDLFEVQNSTDKVSWDYLGQNTTAEYHDFEVVNGTQRYYRVRACNFTGAVWDNSTWTDIDFETVYFLEGAGGVAPALVGMGKYYAMAIILLILGVLIGLGMRGKR